MNRILSISSAMAIAFTLTSCLSDGSSGGSSSTKVSAEPYDLKVDMTETSPYTVDAEAGVINTYEIETYCATGGVLEQDSFLNVDNFKIVDGKLYLWDEYSCQAMVYTGTGTEVVGTTWTFAGLDDLPEGQADEYCDEPNVVNSEYTLLYNGETVRYQGTVKDYCPAKDLAEWQGVNAEATDCKTIILTEAEDTVTWTFNSFNYFSDPMSASYTFTYNGASCDFELKREHFEMTAEACTAAWNAFEAEGGEDYFYAEDYISEGNSSEMAFYSCLVANDFPMDMMTEIDF